MQSLRGENVLLLNQIQQDDSFTLSSSLVKGKLQVADSALGSVVSQLTQVISLATAANNGTMNASNVESISDQIFSGTGANNVFAVLNNLVADYFSGTVDTAKAASDTQALSSALNYVSQQRVVIDNSITQLTTASDAVTNEKTQLIAAQTNLMQADVAPVATQLSLPTAQQTALEAVIAQLGSASNSLFSKL